MIDVAFTALQRFQKQFHYETERHRKAHETAMRVEAFRLRRELMTRLKRGYARRGVRLKPLSFIARNLRGSSFLRYRKRQGIVPDAPLVNLANAITYHVTRAPGGQEVSIGWTRRSPEWARNLAAKHQRGFTQRVSPKLRRLIVREGARRGKAEGEWTPMFLKSTTKSFKTPGRPVISPFWLDVRDEAMDNIRKNFRLKLKGKRI